MIGSLLTRGLTLMLGYTYPAYECFKCVEKNRPDLDSLRFWCQYWMILAMVTVLERVGGDALISWLPLYSEAKLAFIVYLWYPKTKGTTYVYATFVRPFVAQYENEIDGNLGEFRTRAGEILAVYWQRGSTIFQARFVELLQFLASQSPSRVNYPTPPPSNNVYPPRLPSGPRLQSAAGSHQPSAPNPPTAYPAPPPGYPTPPPGYPDLDLSGYTQGPPSGTYPTPPPGYPTVLTRQGPSGGGSNPQPPPPPPGYPGAPRSRASISEEDDEFELVDKNANFPADESAGPNGYMTRARQRALGGDRGRGGGDRGTGSSNLYYGGSGGNNKNS
ncbi:unnamed protein product [Calypogeia fissa]